MKLLAIIAVWALALTPLATPASAAIAKPCSAEMVSEQDSHDQMPVEHHAKDHADLCCVGMASALLAPRMAIGDPPMTEPLLAASPVSKLSGIQPSTADPPPRA